MHDEAQLEQLHREHAGAVRAFVRRRIGDDEADDVVAEVFVVAWRRLDAVPAAPRTWLLGVARKLLANRFRTARRQRALYERLAREAERGPTHAGDAASGMEAGVLLRGLAALRARDREVLLLVTWDGLSHAEAADVLGVRAATLTMRVHRARARLQHAIDADAPLPPAPATSALTQPSNSGA